MASCVSTLVKLSPHSSKVKGSIPADRTERRAKRKLDCFDNFATLWEHTTYFVMAVNYDCKMLIN
jgi:hypothetical protein